MASVTTDVADERDQDMRARVRAAADRVDELDEALRIAREQRDVLIVEACELNYPERQVARWARMSQARVGAILAKH